MKKIQNVFFSTVYNKNDSKAYFLDFFQIKKQLQNSFFELKLKISLKTCFFIFFKIKNDSKLVFLISFQSENSSKTILFWKQPRNLFFQLFKITNDSKTCFFNFLKFKKRQKTCFFMDIVQLEKQLQNDFFELKLKTTQNRVFVLISFKL